MNKVQEKLKAFAESNFQDSEIIKNFVNGGNWVVTNLDSVFLVVSSTGYYDDYHERVECAFLDRENAEIYAKTFDEAHQYESVFNEDIWDLVIGKLDEYENDNPEMFVNPHIEVAELIKIVEFLHNQGLTNATLLDVKKQMEYETHKYDDRHPCKVKEVKLFTIPS